MVVVVVVVVGVRVGVVAILAQALSRGRSRASVLMPMAPMAAPVGAMGALQQEASFAALVEATRVAHAAVNAAMGLVAWRTTRRAC